MKLSLEWLRDYVDLPKDIPVSKLMHDLTMATVEVEGAEQPGSELEKIVVAQIEKLEAVAERPNLKLAHCSIGAGQTPKKVLCGANNIAVGMLVALALPGAKIRPYGEQDEKTVEMVEVSGVKSEAVICAASEIGLETLFPTENKRAVIDLSAGDLSEFEAVPGTPLAEAIGWNDIILEVDNKSLTNRPDLWGHYGMAREFAAIYSCALKPLCPPVTRPQLSKNPGHLIGSLDEASCRRFAAMYLKKVDASPTPFWMKSRLARIGQKSINFYADLTNYVMLASGQPCHVYDAARISMPLSVRRGKVGEKVRLLDGQEYTLNPSILAIADKNGAVAVAGVMGGADSGISSETKEVFLEMANFDPVLVRRGAKQLGLRTDASSRFEKGIDTQRIDGALDLFLTLVRKVQANTEIAEYEDVLVRQTEPQKISVDLQFLLSRLGKRIPASEIETHLKSIGFQVSTTGEQFSVLPPSWRSTGDVAHRFDLIEEVARLHGYDDFQFIVPQVALTGRISNPQLTLERRAREILAFSCGMQEVVTYPWVKDKFLLAAGFETTNMLMLAGAPAPDQACLQPSLVPNLLETVALNLRYYPSFKIFEVGSVFPVIQFHSPSDPREKLPIQQKHIAGVLVGTNPDQLFREAKGILERLRRATHIASFEYEESTSAPWADASGRLGITAAGKAAGTLGILSNRAKRMAGIRRGDVVIFELSLDLLQPLPSRENKYQPVPEFPVVDFDLSLLFSNEVQWNQIAQTAKQAHGLIDEVVFVDQYRGTDIPQGKKSVTLRLRLLSRERTLKSEEAAEVSSPRQQAAHRRLRRSDSFLDLPKPEFLWPESPTKTSL